MATATVVERDQLLEHVTGKHSFVHGHSNH
jgi:hypothetical protein